MSYSMTCYNISQKFSQQVNSLSMQHNISIHGSVDTMLTILSSCLHRNCICQININNK